MFERLGMVLTVIGIGILVLVVLVVATLVGPVIELLMPVILFSVVMGVAGVIVDFIVWGSGQWPPMLFGLGPFANICGIGTFVLCIIAGLSHYNKERR